ncbi:hypothetical protein L249_1511 [Ophiocordyceps polyrhachis-furcata BCC 54312]|uniref:Vacuolar protein sorting-associated protein 62 n=1 Tax=Ophiocordyceps polyrhachis-furcata BCC 54312 TaxID=1330021 RepID=A0A367L4A8_9HYPO|nr:hypothetical protein L249_1511 [Ophiocordyceps polyrhachis-furcata BCC 54312]
MAINRWLRATLCLLTLLASFGFLAWFLPRALNPTETSPEKRREDSLWIETSPHPLDRFACRWLSLCGLHHLRSDPAVALDPASSVFVQHELRRRDGLDAVDYGGRPPRNTRRDDSRSSFRKRLTKTKRRIIKQVPDFVLRHAPYVHLSSDEEFWPSDLAHHLAHMNATDKHGKPLQDDYLDSIALDRLDELDADVTLHSRDNVEARPAWLYSRDGIPQGHQDDDDDDDDGKTHPAQSIASPHLERTTWFDADKAHPPHRLAYPSVPSQQQHDPLLLLLRRRGHKPDEKGRSSAPAVLILVDKGSGILDAFWFFFYSYNLGQTVVGLRFGNHVGDWEHCMVRFQHGIPRGLYLSEHEGGQAYAWSAVEKSADGNRPVVYSALGSHAMYALPGDHPYVLPFGLLKDVTDRGPLWDPALNNLAYHYDYTRDDDQALDPATSNPSAPTSWFHFAGRWGDAVYPLADGRQWRLFGQYHYVTGPSGPKFKHLHRSRLCSAEGKMCRLLYQLDPKGTWY